MLFANPYSKTEDTQRFRASVMAAVFAHALIAIWAITPMTQKIIASEAYSVPTKVHVRFTNPVKDAPVKLAKIVEAPKPVIAKIEPKTIVEKPIERIIPKPQEIAKIEPASGTPDEPLDSVPVVTEVNLKGHRIKPKYPKRALMLGQEGTVWLHVLVSQSGEREEIRLYKGSKYALLNQSALEAVKKWRFEPTRKNGRAIKSWVEIPVEFRIQ